MEEVQHERCCVDCLDKPKSKYNLELELLSKFVFFRVEAGALRPFQSISSDFHGCVNVFVPSPCIYVRSFFIQPIEAST